MLDARIARSRGASPLLFPLFLAIVVSVCDLEGVWAVLEKGQNHRLRTEVQCHSVQSWEQGVITSLVAGVVALHPFILVFLEVDAVGFLPSLPAFNDVALIGAAFCFW